jgi:dTDP-L-rhamnose 4-epimerase
MNILITGGAGFIGTHTAAALHAQGHGLRILDALDPQIHGAGARFDEGLQRIAECQHGDVNDANDCARALDGIDAVFHFAARTGVGQSMYDIGPYVSTNVLGTATLVETIVKQRVALRRFVLSSSRAVYGEGLFQCDEHGVLHPGPRSWTAMQAGDFHVHCPQCGAAMSAVPTPESCDPQPLSVYAMTKRNQEEYTEFAARTFGLPAVTLRYFNVYGSGQSLKNPYTGVISIFYGLLREGSALSLYEGGLPVRDFVHVSDVVQANLRALDDGLKPGGVYNVGTGRPLRIGEVAEALAKATGTEPRFQDRGEFRVGDIFGCYADLSRSRGELGYEPQMDLDAGLAEFAAWARSQQPENRYAETVRELQAHGLFGRAQA